MTLQVRRIVTGHDAKGKAVVASDERLTAVSRGIGANISGCQIWSTDTMPVDNSAAAAAAQRAGLQAGDVILSVGGKTVEGPWGVVEEIRGRGEGAVEVKVMRDRQERNVTVQLEKGKTGMVWSPDDDGEEVLADTLVEPIEIGPLNIAPLRIAPMALPKIHITPMAIPRLHIAPTVIVPKLNVAPMALPPVRVTPTPLPRVVIPKIKLPKVVIPPMRIVVPDMNFRIQV